MVIEHEAEARARSPWRRAVAGVAHAIDLLPDAVALGVGLVVGVAAVAAAAVGGWVWLAGVGAGLAWGLGAGAGLRPRPAGWARPVVGTAVLLGLAGGMLGLAVGREGEGGGEHEIVLAEGVDAMRLDLGDGGSTGAGESTGGSDDTGTSSGGEETSSTGEAASSSGGDESTGGAPPKPPRLQSKAPESAGDDTTSGGGTGAAVAASEGGEAPSCPSGMVFIEGGSFDGHDVKPFCLDVTEVRVSSYERCMADGKCGEAGIEWGIVEDSIGGDGHCNRNQEGRGSHPMNCVMWRQALSFCSWLGKRLPTQWEWEWAARGRDEGRTYPWGEEEPTCARAVMSEGTHGCGKDRTWHVGSRPKGNSRDGVKDMAGNVWEWTSSKNGDRRIVRGGSWNLDDPVYFRASFALNDRLPSTRIISVGFRCAGAAGGSN